VWWSVRAGARVHLVAARYGATSATGETTTTTNSTWSAPFVIDSLDVGPDDARAAERGAAGCARPAPSVAVDAENGFVHVAYVVEGPEGAGIFYAHQMDPRAQFEPPLAIVYGDRLAAARVSSAGNLVAVAYEDPNTTAKSRAMVAISTLAGHRFDERVPVSPATADAHDVYVAARANALVIGWSDVGSTGAPPVFRWRRARVHGS
jgi:hypothetical protein